MSTRRYDPLVDRWVLVSSGRLNRPWQGAAETTANVALPRHDPQCYLCAGNTRSSGVVNPQYSGPYVFDNDFPALAARHTAVPAHAHSLFRSLSVRGRCRVLCYSAAHDLGLGALPSDGCGQVIDTWREQWCELTNEFAWVQVFENRGEMMGASSPHPHGQIWATDHLPDIPATEDLRQAAYFREHGRRLLDDYADAERTASERIVAMNADWLAVVPYWAVWPFEVLLIARAGIRSFADLTPSTTTSLAALLDGLLKGFDALFGVPFPYSMGWHGAVAEHWTLHAHFLPPLLRSATVRKHMVGFELLAETQRDLSPEEAAARLRSAASGFFGGNG